MIDPGKEMRIFTAMRLDKGDSKLSLLKNAMKYAFEPEQSDDFLDYYHIKKNQEAQNDTESKSR